MTATIVPDRASPNLPALSSPVARGHSVGTSWRLLDDTILLLLVVLLFPLVILLIGTPATLLVRLLVEIARRL